ncbi:MAG: DUF2461 domain-containing protein [Acidiferrobacterales bacterium]
MANRYFTQATFDFLSRLEKHNDRDWFHLHKQEYEDLVRSPALDFIADMGDALAAISPHFLAIPKKVGGSLMRVYRDVRFVKDKRPFKTNIGIQFRHKLGKDVHAPGFYLHLEPGECFIGVGIWHPDAPALASIRTAISENGEAWLKASQEKNFKKEFDLVGNSLTNPPRGYARDHPLIGDLKRKDFIAITRIGNKRVITGNLKPDVIKSFRTAIPLMKFLCKSLGLQF